MRLKPGRIAVIAKKVAQEVASIKRLEVKGTPEQIESAIRRIITMDMAREDEIEKEALALLKSKAGQIDPRNIDYQKLVTKAKSEIARRKGLVL